MTPMVLFGHGGGHLGVHSHIGGADRCLLGCDEPRRRLSGVSSMENKIVSLVMLHRRVAARTTRITAALAVATIILAWGVAPWDIGWISVT